MKINTTFKSLTALVVLSLVIIIFNAQDKFELNKFSTTGETLFYTVLKPNQPEFKFKFEAEDYTLDIGKSFTGFKEALGFKESQGDYFTINKHGYLGKYQFGKSTLELIGVTDASKFLNTPELQEKAFLAYAQRNKWVLRKDIKRFSGKTIDGVKITESGILAAAHLAGPGNVKKYLRSLGEANFSDAFGTSVRNYLRKFSGYDTSLIKANKEAKVSAI